MDNNELDTASTPDQAVAGDRPAVSPEANTATEAATDHRAPGAADEVSVEGAEGADGMEGLDDPTVRTAARKRRRGTRGGRNRKKPRPAGEAGDADDEFDDDEFDDEGEGEDNGAADNGAADIGADDAANSDDAAPAKPARQTNRRRPAGAERAAEAEGAAAVTEEHPELPDRMREGRPSPEAAERALVRRPQIGDTRPAPAGGVAAPAPAAPAAPAKPAKGKGGKGGRPATASPAPQAGGERGERAEQPARGGGERHSERNGEPRGESDAAKKKRRRGGKGRSGSGGSTNGGGRAELPELDADVLERRRGSSRNGRPVGRYLMCVQVRPTLTQVAVLEGRTLIEHYVSRPADDVSQIHGNIYVGKVQNVLPGMEAAFVDIGTPKNAVLYRGDVQYDQEDIVQKQDQPRIEQMLRSKQLIVCQVTKNPIGAKGARLTQEVSLPGRFVVLIPNSKTYGISKRLPDDVRKRLRNILDRVKPAEHGLIVRTAAEHATEHELRADMTRLLDQWNVIEAKAKKAGGPALLYREPELAVRVIREEFNSEYRGIVIDDQRLFDDVHDYVGAFNPELADRVEKYDAEEEGLPIFERFHIHEQLHKALDRKVWLPSGGSLIIEHTEALTVIDVNTGKNVGTSNLEETVFRNNLEAAEEVAKQLRLRDIGGIVVIDFIDMEIRDNRRKVVDAFRSALARDKTRTQVFDISELGLVEMTRKRIGEGLLVNFADQCPNCEGRGVVIDAASLE